MPAQDYVNEVQQLYIAYFGRPADYAGLNYWAQQFESASGDASRIVSGFANSPESQALFGPMGSIQARVTAIYEHVLNRAPDPAGLDFYVNAVSNGLSLGMLALEVLKGASGQDAPLIQNKLAAANNFTNQVRQYEGDTAAAVARTFLSQVTSDPNATSSSSRTIAGYVHATEDATSNPGIFANHLGNGVLSDLNVMEPYLTDPVAGTASPTFTVTNNAGTLAFGGTAAGDITFTVASDGTATFVRGGVTASTTVAISNITSAGGSTIKLSANATDLSTTDATTLE
ncbi:DUF4214 domain-containing protein, partial [Zoogloea sp.]|uniref:DUF4214 domain-containing protein n=1 Tax=Zoogloea sp. TaxID=49181 RepID=UPI0035B41C26